MAQDVLYRTMYGDLKDQRLERTVLKSKTKYHVQFFPDADCPSCSGGHITESLAQAMEVYNDHKKKDAYAPRIFRETKETVVEELTPTQNTTPEKTEDTTMDARKIALIEELMTRIGVSDGEFDWVECHLSQAIDCTNHGGSLLDFDWMCHVSDLLGIPISYEMYRRIDRWYEDMSLLELGENDVDELWRCVNYFSDYRK